MTFIGNKRQSPQKMERMLYVKDSPPDLLGRLAVEIHGPRGGVGDRRVQNSDAVLLGPMLI